MFSVSAVSASDTNVSVQNNFSKKMFRLFFGILSSYEPDTLEIVKILEKFSYPSSFYIFDTIQAHLFGVRHIHNCSWEDPSLSSDEQDRLTLVKEILNSEVNFEKRIYLAALLQCNRYFILLKEQQERALAIEEKMEEARVLRRATRCLLTVEPWKMVPYF